MSALGRSLASQGYVIVNRGYPSTAQTIEKSAAIIGQDIATCRAEKATPINFVSHSLGGIVLRQYFQDHEIPDAGRVVMLAPPNHGSEIVDHLKNVWWYQHVTGPAGQELGTDPNSLPNRLRPIRLQIGVIAGARSIQPWFTTYFHSPNDGDVSVSSARLQEMTDFITVGTSHTFVMNSAEVQAQTEMFLAQGRFSHH